MDYLFDRWEKVKKELNNRPLVVFLDFDGTLAPLAATPDRAVLPAGLKRVLKALAASPHTRLAFVSGRTLRDLKKKVGLRNVVYAGNHGLEISGPGIAFRSRLPPKTSGALKRIAGELK